MLISYKQQERLCQHLLLATCVCWVTLLLSEEWAHELNQSFWVVFHPFLQNHHKCWICPKQKGRYPWRYKRWEIRESVSCDFCIQNMAVQITLKTTNSFLPTPSSLRSSHFPHSSHLSEDLASDHKVNKTKHCWIKEWVLWEMRKQI